MAIPVHPLIPAGETTLVETDQALIDLLDHVRDVGVFAYDTEFIGELTYHPKLCLIQIATSQRVALVDPMAGIELDPLWDVLCDSAVTKIVHAGEQDIEPVHRTIGRQAANVFDTQIAAGFCGMAYPVALLKLVHELIGVKLGKGLTFTHWDQRPLSAMQLRYAADDVRYLPAIHASLQDRLRTLGHLDWAVEESESLCASTRYSFDAEQDYLWLRGAGTLGASGLAVLRELVRWRDHTAREHDLPPRAFLRDEVLMDMAKSPAKSLDKLKRVRGLPRPVESQYGAVIVDLTNAACASPDKPPVPEKSAEASPTERFRADALWTAAQAICVNQSIDPAVVTSRQEIGELHRRWSTGRPTDDLRLMRGWRLQALGSPLHELLSGKSSVSLKW